MRTHLQKILSRPDILIQMPQIRSNLWDRIPLEPIDILIISDSLLPESLDDQMEAIQSPNESPAVIALAESPDPEAHARLLADGCDAVLFRGLAIERIRDVIETMLEHRRRKSQKLFFASKPLAEPKLADFVSASSSMAEFMKIVPRMVQSDTVVLIEGETGVGKERLACAIHSEGPRCRRPFVALNCGALPEQLLESELFGHVKGAFTGATSARRGWFEIAHHGTLFLDEIGEIPFHLQVKLLRVLQEREVQPIGSEKSFCVDVRIIAGGNRPLEAEVAAGRFRRDLYHRLSVVSITIPPLRERSEDIPALVNRHIQYITKQLGRHVTGIEADAMDALCRYAWPGNIRELNNVIERAILLCDDEEISLSNLPQSFDDAAGSPADSGAEHSLTLPRHWLSKPLSEVRKEFLSGFEKQYISGLLLATEGRIGEAAQRAGIRERSLYDKMKQHGLHKEDFR
jgi:DNA-binding NtrC family response regulator